MYGMDGRPMPLVYLPDAEALFLWGADPAPRALSTLGQGGEVWSTRLAAPEGLREVQGLKLPLFDTMARLAVVPAAEIEGLSGSLATWVLASKLAMDLVARERMVPTLLQRGGRIEARWAAALGSSEDAAKVAALAKSMPPAAHAVPPAGDRSGAVWAPDALLRSYLDGVVDALVRGARGAPSLPPAKPKTAGTARDGWAERWRTALGSRERSFETDGFAERSVVDALQRWSEPALGARDRLRACFRLELPVGDGEPFVLRFLLQSPDDPSLLVPAAEVWKTKGRSLEKLGRAFRDPQESLLEALGRASRLFPPLGRALAEARPEARSTSSPPRRGRSSGRGRRCSQRRASASSCRASSPPPDSVACGCACASAAASHEGRGVVAGTAGLALDELLQVDWEAVIGDEPLTARELTALAKQKAPLVLFRGAWVAVDPSELGDIQRRLAGGASSLTTREAIQAVLAGETREGGLSVAVTASGVVAGLVEQLRDGGAKELCAPDALKATLRPYQERGLNWLVTMGSLGLGACLADDMGLGKTMQLLAFLLRRREQTPATHARRSDRPDFGGRKLGARDRALRALARGGTPLRRRAREVGERPPPEARSVGRHDVWPPAPRRRAPVERRVVRRRPRRGAEHQERQLATARVARACARPTASR
jgi:hypothetical protein